MIDRVSALPWTGDHFTLLPPADHETFPWPAVILGLGLVAGCAAGPNEMVTGEADAGFLLGLWHGVIAPVTFEAWLSAMSRQRPVTPSSTGPDLRR